MWNVPTARTQAVGSQRQDEPDKQTDIGLNATRSESNSKQDGENRWNIAMAAIVFGGIQEAVT
jgi:hypothetical protein